MALSAVDYWLVAHVVPVCQKASNNMKHEIVTNNPLALFTPESVVDKIRRLAPRVFIQGGLPSSMMFSCGVWTSTTN